ncbi:MAG TPA: hypothetical protein VHL79_18080, partial [Ramlibacter sp.]|nr:hypothetical protein [Ramlibacter sp.]
QPAKDKASSDTSPRAGRTGGLGARAERPADGRAHKIDQAKQGEPTRGGGKPPSPAAGKKAKARELPRPARDSTA